MGIYYKEGEGDVPKMVIGRLEVIITVELYTILVLPVVVCKLFPGIRARSTTNNTPASLVY